MTDAELKMLTDSDFDLAAMYPGEPVADPAVTPDADGCRPVAAVVYPLGVVQLATHAAEVNAVYGLLTDMREMAGVIDVGDAADGLADVATGPAFRLLAACTVPPLADPTTPLARAAAAAWVRQSLAHELAPEPRDDVEDDDVQDDDDDDDRRPSLRVTLAKLVRDGHPLADILHRRQTGPDGRPFPYAGWSVRQLAAWSAAATAARNADHALATSDLVAAIAGTFGRDEGRHMLKTHMARLRA